MKLTTEQITEIVQTLVLNGLIYDDIKLEVIDHIASEIEAKMEESSISFDDALYQVLLNWKDQMKPSWSFMLVTSQIAPLIITQNCHSKVKKQLFISLLISLLITFIILILSRNFNNEVLILKIELGFRILCLISSLLILISRIMIWKSTHNTTFGYLFNRNSLILIFYLFFIGSGLFPIRYYDSNLSLNGVFIFFPIMLFILSIFSLQFAYKHFQFERKLKLS
jgi:hypothetical protein